MLEASEEQNSEPLNIQRYLDLARRRHLQFLIPVLLGWLIVWGTSWVLPARYKSGTLILVQQPTVPKNYVVPNINDNMQDGLQSITQQILSRTRLLLIIDKFKLYSGGRKHRTPDEKVERMRKDIDIELVRNTQDDAITAFKIYYSAHDPHIAQQVTRELSKLFIQGNLEVRQRESEDTTSFLESQLKDASASLAAQEAKIREFKGEHEGELPTQQTTNLQILSGLQSQLQNEQDALNAAKQQRVYLETLNDQYRTLHTSVSSVDGAPTGLLAIDQELGRLKSKLADLRSRYTDLYPDIQSLKQEIARTEKMRDALAASLKSKGKGGSHLERGEAVQSLGESGQNSPVLQLESQLQANKIEIANREQAVAALKARVNDYQARLNAEPVREQQLDDLTRGYDQSKTNYDDLLKKESESKMATSMEQTQQGQRFSILDPPSLPLQPDFPNRLKFCGIGLAFGLVLGAAVVGGLEFFDDRLHDEQEIRTLLPMAVISEIPEISTTWDERRSKFRMAFGWAMAVMVVATILAGSAFSYLHN